MSLSATLFGRDSAIFRITNVLGLGIPGWLDKTFGAKDAQGPGLGEMAVQTSKEGVARPIVWGIVRPIGGNMIAVQDPPLIKKVKERSGGKGGGGSKTTYVDAAFRTYAIRICEGPITGIRRVWRNSKLVYDARGNAWGVKNNPVFLKLAKFYLGGWDQLPAPELQAIFGVAAVTAHRGTCYMTITEENLTDLGGAVPQYIFEVERAEGYALTSKPYPVEAVEGTDQPAPGLRPAPAYVFAEATSQAPASITSGSLRDILIDYSDALPEATDQPNATITSGFMRVPGGVVPYADWPDEATEQSAATLGSTGVLKKVLVTYPNWPAEATEQAAATITTGTLT